MLLDSGLCVSSTSVVGFRSTTGKQHRWSSLLFVRGRSQRRHTQHPGDPGPCVFQCLLGVDTGGVGVGGVCPRTVNDGGMLLCVSVCIPPLRRDRRGWETRWRRDRRIPWMSSSRGCLFFCQGQKKKAGFAMFSSYSLFSVDTLSSSSSSSDHTFAYCVVFFFCPDDGRRAPSIQRGIGPAAPFGIEKMTLFF